MEYDDGIASQGPAMRRDGRGGWVPADPAAGPPSLSLCRWRQRGDGSWEPEPFPYRWAQATPELLRTLGLAPSVSDRARLDTLRRLALGGFVRVARISPGVTLLDLDSWRDHLWRCLADPDYWERGGEADRRYRAANFTRGGE